MLCQWFIVTVRPDGEEDDGLVSCLFPLTSPVKVQQQSPQRTVGGVQTRTITPFVLLNSPAIHRGNSTTHTHTHTASKSDILLEK